MLTVNFFRFDTDSDILTAQSIASRVPFWDYLLEAIGFIVPFVTLFIIAIFNNTVCTPGDGT